MTFSRNAGFVSRRFCQAAAIAVAGLGVVAAGCETMSVPQSDPSSSATTRPAGRSAGVTSAPFGTTSDGEQVTQYTLTNANGTSVDIIDFGGAVRAIRVPDRNGNYENVTLYFDTVAGYETSSPYFGALIGRFGNRIAGGQFELNGETYTLATNNAPNHLHGGVKGFDKRLWDAEPTTNDGDPALRLSYTSPDGEEGYPSTLETTVVYTLTDNDELRIDYEAKNTGEKDTVVNLTNHAYWNLDGVGSGPITDHVLQLFCNQYLPVDETAIPTGELKSVEGTPFDFRQPKPIGQDIDETEGEPNGYDHNFIVSGDTVTIDGTEVQKVAKVVAPDSGRVMEVFSTEPGVQLYTGNFLAGDAAAGGNAFRTGFCLETQHFPDSPNRPEFPSTVLEAGDTYTSTTVHRFSVQK